jgi:hypothetical protein
MHSTAQQLMPAAVLSCDSCFAQANWALHEEQNGDDHTWPTGSEYSLDSAALTSATTNSISCNG